jgi:hypothetical protein
MKRYGVKIDAVEGDALEHIWIYGIQPVRIMLQLLCGNDVAEQKLDKASVDIMLNEILAKVEDMEEVIRKQLCIGSQTVPENFPSMLKLNESVLPGEDSRQ